MAQLLLNDCLKCHKAHSLEVPNTWVPKDGYLCPDYIVHVVMVNEAGLPITEFKYQRFGPLHRVGDGCCTGAPPKGPVKITYDQIANATGPLPTYVTSPPVFPRLADLEAYTKIYTQTPNMLKQVQADVTPPVPRKEFPLFSGCLNYFPDALLAVARHSKFGNDKHNPGQPLHWSKDKSKDHADCIARHLVDHGKIDPETGWSHSVALAWRALALLQTEIENAR